MVYVDLRIRVLESIRIFGAIQFILGFLLLFFAFYCIYLHVGDTQSGTIPYYAGGHVAGFSLILHSCVSVVIFHRGQHIRAAPQEVIAVGNVRPLMFVSIITAPFVGVCSIIGIVITVLYGLCATRCSFEDNDRWNFNYGMAGFLVFLEILALLISIITFSVLLKYRRQFGVNVKRSLSMMVGMHDGTKDPEEQKENDVYNLEKWRQGVEDDVNFPKIRRYLDDSRPEQEPEAKTSIASDISVIHA